MKHAGSLPQHFLLMPSLAQCNAGDEITFTEVEVDIAQKQFLQQQKDLLYIQTASKFKMEQYALRS